MGSDVLPGFLAGNIAGLCEGRRNPEFFEMGHEFFLMTTDSTWKRDDELPQYFDLWRAAVRKVPHFLETFQTLPHLKHMVKTPASEERETEEQVARILEEAQGMGIFMSKEMPHFQPAEMGSRSATIQAACLGFVLGRYQLRVMPEDLDKQDFTLETAVSILNHAGENHLLCGCLEDS